jgi:hypothetical protein
MSLLKPAALGAVGFVVAVAASMTTGELLALIVAIDLAQFGIVMDHRGRIAAAESAAGVEE